MEFSSEMTNNLEDILHRSIINSTLIKPITSDIVFRSNRLKLVQSLVLDGRSDCPQKSIISSIDHPFPLSPNLQPVDFVHSKESVLSNKLVSDCDVLKKDRIETVLSSENGNHQSTITSFIHPFSSNNLNHNLDYYAYIENLKRKRLIQQSEASSDISPYFLETNGNENIQCNSFVFTSSEIDESSMIYEKFALDAIHRIQRIYRGHLGYRKRLAERICSFYKRYQQKRNFLVYKNILYQSLRLIQGRFRVHLIRINRLSSKIKQWYKSRKYVKHFRQWLNIFNSAKKIQKRIRGMIARKYYDDLWKKHQSALIIQRLVISVKRKKERNLALSSYFHLFQNAAICIQCFIRSYFARKAIIRKLLYLISFQMYSSILESYEWSYQSLQEFKYMNEYLKSSGGKQELIHTKQQMMKNEKNRVQNEEDWNIRAVTYCLESILGVNLLTAKIGVEQIIFLCKLLQINASSCPFIHEMDSKDEMDVKEFLTWYFYHHDHYRHDSKLITKRISILQFMSAIITIFTNHDYPHHYLVHERASSLILRRNISVKRILHGRRKLKQMNPSFLRYQCPKCFRSFLFFSDYHSHGHDCNYGDKKFQQLVSKFWKRNVWICHQELCHEIFRHTEEHIFIQNQLQMDFYDSSVNNPSIKFVKKQLSLLCRNRYSDSFHAVIDNNNSTINSVNMVVDVISSILKDILCFDDSRSVLSFGMRSLLKKRFPLLFDIDDVKNESYFNVHFNKTMNMNIIDSIISSLCLDQLSFDQNSMEKILRILEDLYVDCIFQNLQDTLTELSSLFQYQLIQKRRLSIPDSFILTNQLNCTTNYEYQQRFVCLWKQAWLIQESVVNIFSTSTTFPSNCILNLFWLSNLFNDIGGKVIIERNPSNYLLRLLWIDGKQESNRIHQRLLRMEELFLHDLRIDFDKMTRKLDTDKTNSALSYNHSIHTLNVLNKKYYDNLLVTDTDLTLKSTYRNNVVNDVENGMGGIDKIDGKKLTIYLSFRTHYFSWSPSRYLFQNRLMSKRVVFLRSRRLQEFQLEYLSLGSKLIEPLDNSKYTELKSQKFHLESNIMKASNEQNSLHELLMTIQPVPKIRMQTTSFTNNHPSYELLASRMMLKSHISCYSYMEFNHSLSSSVINSLYFRRTHSPTNKFYHLETIIEIYLLSITSGVLYVNREVAMMVTSSFLFTNKSATFQTFLRFDERLVSCSLLSKNIVSRLSEINYTFYQFSKAISIFENKLQQLLSQYPNILRIYDYEKSIYVEDRSSYLSRLVTCQTNSMKQCLSYFDTIFGKIHIEQVCKEIATNNHRSMECIDNTIRFAVSLFSHYNSIILSTELPYVISYLRKYHKIVFNDLDDIFHVIFYASINDDNDRDSYQDQNYNYGKVTILNENQVFNFLRKEIDEKRTCRQRWYKPNLKLNSNSNLNSWFRKSYRLEAKVKILSRSRTEAISMSFGLSLQPLYTTYRCGVLGLEKVMKTILSSNVIKNSSEYNPHLNAKLIHIPVEAMIYLLSTLGFSVEDIGKIPDDYLRFEGLLNVKMISLEKAFHYIYPGKIDSYTKKAIRLEMCKNLLYQAAKHALYVCFQQVEAYSLMFYEEME